jgi:polyhydroxyalkanoate synthesis repressor PhaR
VLEIPCLLVFSAGDEALKVNVGGGLGSRLASGQVWDIMATDKQPTVIKKYANRRLYHTGTSTYVTLEDLAHMVREGEDFVVYDAKSGEEITRSVLTQIIFEQENKEGQNLLPVTFLRQLIRFYGDSLQSLVPSYLEYSMENLSREQQKLREQMAQAFGPAAFHAMEEQVRTNMSFFTEAMRMFSPFAQTRGEGKGEVSKPDEKAENGSDLDALKRQMADMQAKLDALSRK